MDGTGERIMFEIYRTAAGGGAPYRVVYFTELDDRNREAEIARAMDGDHVYDGFISGLVVDRAKRSIAALLDRLNAGEQVSPGEVDTLLAPFAPAA